MADIKEISKVTLPNGNTYIIKDATAREALNGLTGAMHYIGVTTSNLYDGASVNPVVIGGENVTAKSGNVVMFGTMEFVFSETDSKWHEFGSTGSLKKLAFADEASGKYTPSGSVSAPTITVTPATTTVNSMTSVGELPVFSASVSNETLILGWSNGALPTKGENQLVVTGATATATQPTFTGLEGTITVTTTQK